MDRGQRFICRGAQENKCRACPGVENTVPDYRSWSLSLIKRYWVPWYRSLPAEDNHCERFLSLLWYLLLCLCLTGGSVSWLLCKKNSLVSVNNDVFLSFFLLGHVTRRRCETRFLDLSFCLWFVSPPWHRVNLTLQHQRPDLTVLIKTTTRTKLEEKIHKRSFTHWNEFLELLDGTRTLCLPFFFFFFFLSTSSTLYKTVWGLRRLTISLS